MPNVIRFTCPSCKADVSAGPQYAGLQGPCPGCKAAIVVPDPPPPADAPTAQTPAVGKTLITAAPWGGRPSSSG